MCTLKYVCLFFNLNFICTQSTGDLFVVVVIVVEHLNVCNNTVVLSTSASQYPLMLLVINRMYLIREYNVLIGDPIAVQILRHNLSLSSVSRYPVAYESTHAPKLAVINRTCHVHLLQELSRASTACFTATQPALWYSTYIVLLFNTIGESFPLCILVQINYSLFLATFSPQDFIFTFETR